MTHLSEISVVFPALFLLNQLPALRQTLYMLADIRISALDLVSFVYERWLDVRQNASDIKGKSVLLQIVVIYIIYNIFCK